MALPGIKNNILDGAMGVQGAQADGRFAAIGVAEKFGQGILTLNDPELVEPAIGDGPLRDLLVSSLSISRTPISVIALQGTLPGTLSAVTPGSDNQGDGVVTVSGSPRNEYDIDIEIISTGALNEGTFRVTIDGLPGKQITIPDGNGQYAIPGTGITITFNSGDGTFNEGDTFSFSATAPSATNGEVLEAIDTILRAKLSIEWIAIAGISSAPLWAALATKAIGAAEIYQYLFFVAQARYVAANETLDQWANALAGDERGTVGSQRLQVCAGWIEEADANGQVDVRGLIGAYCGTLAARKVMDGPDAVKFGGITAATALKPDGINDGHIENLKNAGYVTARKYVGLKGIYITSGQMMSEEGSDFDLVERRRVMDKACRNLYVAQLPALNDTVTIGKDGSPEGIEMFVAKSQQPLETMKTNREISDGYVIVPPGQNILADKKLRTKVRIVPLGKMSYIENEIAYKNPALGGEE
ncbi:hypothetical protein AGMMS50268_13320 [Spirochaetia bacterium]|nr:hypothetical protein AGMMS50233_09870 [Endomicrobiia bacterium]GHV90829.1 hypothetical protein AGMMS50268_13320 [Spirochaetia bacterium]